MPPSLAKAWAGKPHPTHPEHDPEPPLARPVAACCCGDIKPSHVQYATIGQLPDTVPREDLNLHPALDQAGVLAQRRWFHEHPGMCAVDP